MRLRGFSGDEGEPLRVLGTASSLGGRESAGGWNANTRSKPSLGQKKNKGEQRPYDLDQWGEGGLQGMDSLRE